MRALVELMAALKGTVTVALARARPRTLIVGAGLGVAALALGVAQLVADDSGGPDGDAGLGQDVPGGGQLSPPGDRSVPGTDGRPLVAGLYEAPVAPPRSGDAEAAGVAGTGDMVGTGGGGPGSTGPGPGSPPGGGTAPAASTTEPPGPDTTVSPGTTATTATNAPPDPGERRGGLEAVLDLLGLG